MTPCCPSLRPARQPNGCATDAMRTRGLRSRPWCDPRAPHRRHRCAQGQGQSRRGPISRASSQPPQPSVHAIRDRHGRHHRAQARGPVAPETMSNEAPCSSHCLRSRPIMQSRDRHGRHRCARRLEGQSRAGGRAGQLCRGRDRVHRSAELRLRQRMAGWKRSCSPRTARMSISRDQPACGGSGCGIRAHTAAQALEVQRATTQS